MFENVEILKTENGSEHLQVGEHVEGVRFN
jgi:hypothetical protein